MDVKEILKHVDHTLLLQGLLGKKSNRFVTMQ